MTPHWTVPAPPLVTSANTVSTRSIARFIGRWKLTIIGVLVAVVALVTVMLYLLPQTFLAEATVLVERNRAPIMRADLSPGLEMAEVMNTEKAIAGSRAVFARVVDDLRLAERPVADGLFRRLQSVVAGQLIAVGLWPDLPPREAWIHKLGRWTTIKPIVNSNVLSIAARSDSPELSAAVANAITQEYMNQRIRIYSTEGLADFYKQQADAAENSYRTRLQMLVDFKDEHGILASDAAKMNLGTELSALRTQLLISSEDLARLRQRYGPDHLEVRLVERSIATAQERIAETEQKLQTAERNEARIADMEMLIDEYRKTFIGYNQRYREARMDERAGKDIVNVRVVDEATVPAKPTTPRLLLIIAATIGAAILAVGVASLREYLDSRAATPAAVERALGVAVIGGVEVLPRHRVRRLLTRATGRKGGGG